MSPAIELKKVEKKDCSFLYEMLKERTPKINISFEMPNYNNHVLFCMNHPYDTWYIIWKNKESIGNIYITKNNEIGVFVTKKANNQNIGTRAIKLLKKYHPRKNYYANIAPKNKKSQEFFKKLGFEHIQNTYKL